jgi:hypothetical protein
MVVEIDPSDVVSVPLDCDCQKLRTCKYKVVSLFEKKLEQPMCDEYGDYYDEELSEQKVDDYDDGYNAGYDAAKKDLVKFAESSPKRDADGRFSKC